MNGTTFRPLLKWPGGKAREWSYIEPYLPTTIRNLVDPFMGGCAPFSLTEFSGRAYLNDKHARLVDLHVRVQSGDAGLFSDLAAIGDAWNGLTAVAAARAEEFAALVAAARRGEPVREAAANDVTKSMRDKAHRLAKLEAKHGVHFDAAAIDEHGETSIRAAYYNRVRTEERTAVGARAAACFLFVREYCYGAMFRNNAKGEFNIPYGGTSYNRQSFLARTERLRSVRTRNALARATFTSLDFEAFLGAQTPGADDFVFVDPPYDTTFRTYGQNAFTPADQARLAATLARLNAPWLLVAKETPDLHRLYADELKRGSFGKTYAYNVRGRNDRTAQHIVIANYAPPATMHGHDEANTAGSQVTDDESGPLHAVRRGESRP